MKWCGRVGRAAGMVPLVLLLGACAMNESGYGVSAQAERAALMQQATDKNSVPDTPGLYLGLITRMQQQGLYYASLAHIDAYEKQYGVSPDTILLRADALRATGQPAAAAASYKQLLNTPLAAHGYRGLGLLAGAASDFEQASRDLKQASILAPTDASMLSDLAYARLRSGDIQGARVPLLKAAELDQKNPKIISNLALFLLASGQKSEALGLMNQENLSPQIRSVIRTDAAKVIDASYTHQHTEMVRSALTQRAAPASTESMTSNQSSDLPGPLLQRFSQ